MAVMIAIASERSRCKYVRQRAESVELESCFDFWGYLDWYDTIIIGVGAGDVVRVVLEVMST